MKKGLLWLGLVLAMILTIGACDIAKASDSDNEVSYSIPSYKGHLAIHEDGGATFTQEVTYDFSSSYNGQYVTLGSVKPLPKGFNIEENPTVTVSDKAEKITTENGVETVFTKRQIRVESEKLKDGIKLKVYNPGAYDKVVLKVTWQIKHMLDLYSDVAALNWFPISDWDNSIEHVDFTVTGLDAAKGDLYAHTGFFNKKPTVTRTPDGFKIHIDDLAPKGKLELHAYWPMTKTLKEANASYIKNEAHKTTFLNKVAHIVRMGVFFRFLSFQLIPSLIIIVTLMGILFFIWLLISTRLPDFPKNSRLYEAPNNLAPLVVAKSIYNQSFDKISLKEEKGPLSFGHMIQATILDLLDRGHIVSKSSTLAVIQKEGLSTFEETFIDMMFDGRSEITKGDIFSRYYIDKKELSTKFKKAKSTVEREKIKDIGLKVKAQFSSDVYKLSKEVDREVRNLGLVKIYREFTPLEKRLSLYSHLSFAFAFVVSFVSGLFFAIAFGASLSVFYFFAIIPIFLLWLIVTRIVKKRRKRCLDKATIDTYYQWYSFRNMIKSIPSFKQTEIDAIVLWNRILVYATLYGYAKKVTETLKKYHIHLSNPSLESTLDSDTSFNTYVASQMLQGYISNSDTVSSFSINSNSGSGGFGGGGFSGGGGGGGGGAF